MRKHTKNAEKHPIETIGIDLGDKMSRYCIVKELRTKLRSPASECS